MVGPNLITLATTDFGSIVENVPRLKLSNMYIITNPTSLSGQSYVSRPSLSFLSSFSGKAIRGLFSQESTGQTAIYVVAGNNLYTFNSNGAAVLIGATPGTGFCSFASTVFGIAIVSDGNLYLYDGTTLTGVSIPDSQRVSSVTSLDNYFIVSIEETNKFYWIRPGETTIDPLNFESAERNPADIVAVKTIGDEMWSLGRATVEIFTDSGDTNAPFTRIAGRVYQIGCADRNSVVLTNKNTLPCLIWVTPNREVVLAQGVPAKVSNESIEELLRLSSTFTGWAFRVNRHDFYVLTTDNETLVFDITTGDWYRWSTYKKNTWDALLGIQVDNVIYAGSTSGNVYTLANSSADNTSDYIVCEVGGFIPNSSNQAMPCDVVTLFMNYGFSPSYVTGPLVELRFSDDSQSTWSPYFQGSLGLKGGYSTTLRFRSLGSFRRPGRYIEFRFSQLSSFRLDGATLNSV